MAKTAIANLPGVSMLPAQSPTALASQPVGSTALDPTSGNVYMSTGGGYTMVSSGTVVSGTGLQRSAYDTVFYTKDGRQISVSEIADFMDLMRRRMLALTPNFEAHEQYPALKRAYDEYLLVERMVMGDGKK